MEGSEVRRLALDLTKGLELPFSFIRTIEMLKKDRSLGRSLPDEDRKILWAAEQGLRQIDAILTVGEAGTLLPEPVAVRGIVEEVMADFGQFWRLTGEQPVRSVPREQILVDANRRILKCFLSSLLTESLQFGVPGRLFARKNGGLVQIGVRDFGPSLPRGFECREGQVLPLRPKSGSVFLVLHELAHGMNVDLKMISHRDGASFFVELLGSRQARLL
jgi:hypothetical protein